MSYIFKKDLNVPDLFDILSVIQEVVCNLFDILFGIQEDITLT